MVIPVHKQARAQQDARHVPPRGRPIAERGDKQDTDDDIDQRREDVNETTSLVPVLRTLDLDAGVLCQRDHDRQCHDQAQPIGVRVGAAGPDRHEVLAHDHEPTVDEPEQDHLVAADPGHEPSESVVVVIFGDNPVDLGDEHVRHGRAHSEENVPDLHRDRERGDCAGARHRAQKEVRHVVVHQIEDLVQEDPETEHRNHLEQAPLQSGEHEPHAKHAHRVTDVQKQQDRTDRELRVGHADGPHTQIQKQNREQGHRQRGEQLSGLLERKPFMCHDKRVERRGHQLHRDVHAHNHQQLTS